MRLLQTVDRLVIREVVPPTVLGFMTYTFLVVLRALYNLIEQITVRGVPAADAGKLLLMSLPHVVILTVPMSFLFGVLIAVGRMNGDNELVALQAGGISVRRLLRPILVLGVLLSLVTGALSVYYIPGTSRQMRELRVKLFTEARNLGRLDPKVFHEEIPNVLLYIRDIEPDSGAWLDVLLFDTSNPGEERLTLARRGRLVVAAAGPGPGPTPAGVAGGGVEQWIRLEDVVTHQFSRRDPETYRINRNTSQLIRAPIGPRGETRYRPGIRERSSAELLQFIRGGELADAGEDDRGSLLPPSEEDRRRDLRQARIELNRRVAIPFACVVFALIALPLGIGSGSGGRGRGFVISVAVILAYYLVANQGEVLALEGTVPAWLGIWLPNIVLVAVAVALMRRMGRWLGERESREKPVARAIAALGGQLRRLRNVLRPGTAVSEMSGSFPVAVQRRRYVNRFPALVDRYLTRRLLPPLLLVVVSTVSLYVVADLSQNLEDMSKNRVPLEVAVSYYLNLMPQIVLDVMPMALMIAVLILLTLLEQHRELTALKAAGISLYRLTVPMLLLATVAAVGLWMLGELVVPHANREAQRLEDRIEGRDTARSYRASDRQWLLSRDGRSLYNFLRYDESTRTLIRFTKFELGPDASLKSHLFTRRATFQDGQWVADSGWSREFYGNGTDRFRRVTSPVVLDIDEGPTYFSQEYRSPAEMTAGELRHYIAEIVASGYRPANLIVRWHQKLTYPLSAFVMVMLALPFGLSRGGRRVSTMQGIAIALTLGIAYFMLVALFGKLGEVEVLPPVLGAWAPVVLAALFAVNRLTTLRT